VSRVVTVEVTAEDIKKGNAGNCFACPIALALSRACDTSFVYVGPNKLSVKDVGFCLAPDVAREFMRDFDIGEPVKPFTFTVELS
jgi:hypothetical protein